MLDDGVTCRLIPMRSRLTIAAVSAVLCLSAATSSFAATTIGVTTAGTPTVVPPGCAVATDNVPVTCSLYLGSVSDPTQIAPGGLATATDGVITRWRVDVGPHTATSLTLKPRVLRFTTLWTMIRSGTPREIPAAGGTLTFEDRLPVQRDDFFAIDSVANGLVGAGPPVVASIATNASYLTKTPAVADGATFPIQIVIGPPTQTKLLINADVEPDVDLDGYGDESQDGCVLRSDVHDPCPAPVMSKPRAVRNGLALTLDRAARADITLDRVSVGHRKGKRCSKRVKRGKRCSIFSKFAQWDQDVPAGTSTISFAYKVGKRKLGRGNYRAKVVITNTEGLKTEASLRFRVKR